MNIDQDINALMQRYCALRFEFHEQGCRVIMTVVTEEYTYEMSHYDLLRLGIESQFLTRLMHAGTVQYFSPEVS